MWSSPSSYPYRVQVESHIEVGPLVLTDIEQTLVDHVIVGEVLDLADAADADQPVDEQEARAWGADRTIRAAVLRDILRARLVSDPDPRGLRLRGARIDGVFDFEYLTSTVAIELIRCVLASGVIARGATLPAVTFEKCWLGHRSQPSLNAEGLRTDVLSVAGSTIIGHSALGALALNRAHLGHFQANGATLTNDIGPALFADGLTVDGSVVLSQGFTAIGAGPSGVIRLSSGHIGGQLNCNRATLTNKTGPALVADGLAVDQTVGLRDGFRATANGELGAVRLQGAHLGQLEADGAIMVNEKGAALHADQLLIDGSLFLRSGLKATGSGGLGAVRLLGGHIGGQLDCTGATLTNKTGPALYADFLTIGSGMILSGGFAAEGSGEPGAIRFVGCHIGGQLNCTGATLTNKTGPAVVGDHLTVDQSVFLASGFKATGDGKQGAIRLIGGHIGGQLSCTGATLTNKTGPALVAEGLTVSQSVLLTRGFIATGGGESVVLDLINLQVGGGFIFQPERLEHETRPNARLNINGLTYAGRPVGVTTQEWLRLIRDATPSYAAQPYQYLAAALNAAGHDGEAREVLITQRRDQIDRNALTGKGDRAWARFTGVMLGYGYKPSRALVYLLGVIIASVALALTLGAHGGLAYPNPLAGKPAIRCSTLQQVGAGLNLGEPMVSTNTQCNTTNSTSGEALTASRWTLQILAWTLATLFIAGFTSAVRKT
jgi:hypothetical protein